MLEGYHLAASTSAPLQWCLVHFPGAARTWPPWTQQHLEAWSTAGKCAPCSHVWD